MDKVNVLLLLAALVLALLVAIGGDKTEYEDHAKWMADTKAAGTAVIW